jgi:hypothetical protein
MTSFLGSWFLAWLLGGGLILAVVLYALFFSKKPLVPLAFAALFNLFSKRKSPRLAQGSYSAA